MKLESPKHLLAVMLSMCEEIDRIQEEACVTNSNELWNESFEKVHEAVKYLEEWRIEFINYLLENIGEESIEKSRVDEKSPVKSYQNGFSDCSSSIRKKAYEVGRSDSSKGAVKI